MDFGLLPPEINSGRMYAGPGSGPLLAAAAAWNGLAAEMESAARSYGSVIAGLTSGPWLGPSSASMAAAAAPYMGWMTATAARATQAATQAQAAVAAHEAAFTATVPPPVIAANRSLLMALVATNFLGQNTPAIMATEAHYLEMWAQDAATMYCYAGASAVASTLTPFTAAPPTTNPGELTAAGAQALSAVPDALQSLAAPLTSTSGPSGILSGLVSESTSWLSAQFADLLQGMTGSSTLSLASPLEALNTLSGPMSDVESMFTGLFSFGKSLVPVATDVSEAAKAAALPGISLNLPHIPGLTGVGGGGLGAVTGLGQASSIGGLSVPPSWAAAAPAASSEVPATLSGSTWSGASGAIPAADASPGMPLAASPMGMSGFARGVNTSAPRYGSRLFVVAHPPSAG
jgi:PPE-repeat protein